VSFLDRLLGVWRVPPPVVLRTKSVHGMFLRKPLGLVGLRDGVVVRTGILRPWRVVTWRDVDTIVEVDTAGESSEDIQI
jgi:hypothetical protein